MSDETSLWKKTGDDLTVGDSVKIAAGITVVCTVIPFALYAGAGCVAVAGRKIKGMIATRRNKSEKED